MHGISYQLRLLEPILLNSLEGDNNTAQSHRFIPGSVMRGAVIAAYLAERRRNAQAAEIDAAEDDARRLFFSGATRYLNAYPYDDEHKERALPTLLSWRRKKGDEVTTSPIPVFDLSLAPDNGEERLQGLGRESLFCVRAGEAGEVAYQVDAPRRLSVHTQRDAWLGRAVEGLGAVYRYEALQAGARFAGIILTDSADDAERLLEMLDGAIAWLGKARTAGYGRVRFESVTLLDANWTEASGTMMESYHAEDFAEDAPLDEEWNSEKHTEAVNTSALPSENTHEFTLTFLSDAIVRDELGQHILDPLPALRRRLHLDEKLEIARSEEQPGIYHQVALVGGFNRQWNLPLPQVAAIAAGSVFKLRLSREAIVTFEQLRDLQATGLGERRAEGFGRLAINWTTLGTISYSKLSSDATVSDAARDLTEQERKLAEQTLQRLLRLDLDKQLLNAAARIEIEKKRSIPNSQLSRWRSIARSVLVQSDLKRLIDFHTNEAKKASAAWEQMRRARVEGSKLGEGKQLPRLTDWIKEVLTRPDALKTELELLPERTLGKELKQTVTKELEDEYRIRLLDAVLSRKAKQQAKERASQRGAS